MITRISFLIGLAISVFSFTQCTEQKPKSRSIKKRSTVTAKKLNYSLVDTIKHDTNAFTEGLEFYQSHLYESTGSPAELPQAKSFYGIVNSPSGDVQPLYRLEEPLFGEGITVFNDQVYQLTYQSGKGFIYNAKTNKRIRHFNLPSAEGWGLTHDSTQLIMSDGTQVLYFLHPVTLEVNKKLMVTQNGKFKGLLNELEYVNGSIYANIFMSNEIVKINAKTGKVEGYLDLNLLKKAELQSHPNAKEMNGIAYHAPSGHFYITGKMWKHTYIISILD